MKNFTLYLAVVLLIACSATTEKIKEQNLKEPLSSNEAKSAEFSGKFTLNIEGQTYEYDALTKSGSRLSFQDRGIALYIENLEGEGTIAQITILSENIYKSNSQTYEVGKKDKVTNMMDVYNQKADKSKDNLRLRFRRIDQMDAEKYLSLKQGKVTLTYDDKAGDCSISFEGTNNNIEFSGSLELKGAYLMDSRD